VVLEIPEAAAITSIDAEKHPLVGPVAKGCSELVSLTLWLMAERGSGGGAWAALLAALPQQTLSPILWGEAELLELAGSPVLEEARARRGQLQQQWQALQEQHFGGEPGRFDPGEPPPPPLLLAARAVALAPRPRSCTGTVWPGRAAAGGLLASSARPGPGLLPPARSEHGAAPSSAARRAPTPCTRPTKPARRARSHLQRGQLPAELLRGGGARALPALGAVLCAAAAGVAAGAHRHRHRLQLRL
jgi:hypothetical protein